MSAARAELRILHEEPTFKAGILGNCLVTARRGKPMLRHLQAQLRIQRELLKQSDPVGGLNLLLDSHLADELLLDEPVRAVMRQAFELSRDRPGAIAMVVEGAPFLRATARMVISATTLAARMAAPTKMFEDCATACAWLAPRVVREGSPSVEDLSIAIEQMRRGLQ